MNGDRFCLNVFILDIHTADLESRLIYFQLFSYRIKKSNPNQLQSYRHSMTADEADQDVLLSVILFTS